MRKFGVPEKAIKNELKKNNLSYGDFFKCELLTALLDKGQPNDLSDQFLLARIREASEDNWRGR